MIDPERIGGIVGEALLAGALGALGAMARFSSSSASSAVRRASLISSMRFISSRNWATRRTAFRR